jgi:hypothetical protein
MMIDPEKVYYIGKETVIGTGVWEIQGIFFDKELGKINMKEGEFMVEIAPDIRLPDTFTDPDIYWWKFDGEVKYYGK